MYVCMSENLYPARLKQKRHSRAAISNGDGADAFPENAVDLLQRGMLGTG